MTVVIYSCDIFLSIIKLRYRFNYCWVNLVIYTTTNTDTQKIIRRGNQPTAHTKKIEMKHAKYMKNLRIPCEKYTDSVFCIILLQKVFF